PRRLWGRANHGPEGIARDSCHHGGPHPLPRPPHPAPAAPAGRTRPFASEPTSRLPGFASDCPRLPAPKDPGSAETEPRRGGGGRPRECRGAVRLDDRNASRAVCEPPETLELEAVRRLPLREEGEISLDGLLAVAAVELPRRVEQHPAPPVWMN